jgi:hypothetical protein
MLTDRSRSSNIKDLFRKSSANDFGRATTNFDDSRISTVNN